MSNQRYEFVDKPALYNPNVTDTVKVTDEVVEAVDDDPYVNPLKSQAAKDLGGVAVTFDQNKVQKAGDAVVSNTPSVNHGESLNFVFKDKDGSEHNVELRPSDQFTLNETTPSTTQPPEMTTTVPPTTETTLSTTSTTVPITSPK